MVASSALDRGFESQSVMVNVVASSALDRGFESQSVMVNVVASSALDHGFEPQSANQGLKNWYLLHLHYPCNI